MYVCMYSVNIVNNIGTLCVYTFSPPPPPHHFFMFWGEARFACFLTMMFVYWNYYFYLKNSGKEVCPTTCSGRFTCNSDPDNPCHCRPDDYCDDVNLFCDDYTCASNQIGTCNNHRCSCVAIDYCKLICADEKTLIPVRAQEFLHNASSSKLIFITILDFLACFYMYDVISLIFAEL